MVTCWVCMAVPPEYNIHYITDYSVVTYQVELQMVLALMEQGEDDDLEH